MRRIANLLICVAGALWLATSGFVELSGRAFAQDAAREAARKAAVEAERKAVLEARLKIQIAQNDAMVLRFEQQLGPQFRQLYRTELHFMRVVCQPTKLQYEKISADAEPALKASTKNYAANLHGIQGGVPARPTITKSSDPRTPITDALVESVRTTLSPEHAARYRKELDQRAAARKRAAALNLLVQMDKVLVLTTEQRSKLGQILEDNSSESWSDLYWVLSSGQYFPLMPDWGILPILTEPQRHLWRGIPQRNIRIGFNLGNVQGIEIEDEVWDNETKPAEKQ